MQQKHKRHHHPRPVVPIHAHVGQQLKLQQHNKQQQQQQQNKHKHKQQQQQQEHSKQQQRDQQRQHKAKHKDGPGHKQPAAGAGPAGEVQQQQQQQQQQQHSKKQKTHHNQQQHSGTSQHQKQPKPQQGQQQHSHAHQAVRQQQHPQQQPAQLHPGVQQHQQEADGHALLQQQQQHKKSSKKRKRGSGAMTQEAVGRADGANCKAAPAGALAAAAAAAAAAATAGPGEAAVSAVPRKPWQVNSTTAVSSNWQALQQQLKAAQASAAASGQHKPFRRKRKAPEDTAAAPSSSSKAPARQISSLGRNSGLTPVVAMDCEMVGVGPKGDRDSLARVSIVNASGNVLLDTFVAQKEPVVDYRTWVSGVTPQHLVGAPSMEDVQKKASELLSGRVVVGHSLNKDLKVLLLSHPRKDIRDTAKYPPFMFSKGGKRRPKALKQLALQELGLTIQEGQHSSVDDARAALYLYQKHAAEWERALRTPRGIKQLPTSNQAARKKRVASYGATAVTNDPMADL